jgi:6-phosphogluconolactonase
MKEKIQVFADGEAISLAAAKTVVELANQAIKARGAFHLALSGGSTPKRLYQHLASKAFSDQVDWSQVHIYFGDERSVAPDHADSNYRMACEAMLKSLPIPSTQVHRMRGESEDLVQAAQQYGEVLMQHLPKQDGWPVFDLVLLGMGDDGHTASLFPGTTALDEQRRPVTEVYVPQLSTWRITLTYPVINHARQVLLLVAGASKTDRLYEVLIEAPAGTYPVMLVKPKQGELDWYLDEAAAAKLPKVI